MFCAARADHLEQRIRPALRAGTWVLCDRFLDSTRAYQGAAAGVAAEDLKRLEQIVVGATLPDLTIILDLPASEGLARAAIRHDQIRAERDASRDAFEARNIEYHEQLRTGFLAIAEAEPERCVVVDARQSILNISQSIWAVVTARLGVV